MGSEHTVEDWIPGGVAAERRPSAETAEFTLEGGSVNGSKPSRLARPEREQTTVDLNAIDFEELLAIGISVGQAARFISQRERRGGISSLAEIEAFYGLAPSVREILRLSGHV